MTFLEDYGNNEFILKINVKTNSKKQKILNFTSEDSSISINLQSKPIKNKANKELVELISNKLLLASNQVKIISGVKSPTKRIKLTFSRQINATEIANLLQKL